MAPMKRVGLRVALAVSTGIALSAAIACTLDLSQFDSQYDAAPLDAAGRDGSPAPEGGDANAACQDVAACGFCAKHRNSFFCDDWDEGQTDAAAGWSSPAFQGGGLTVARDAWVSPPASLFVANEQAYLSETLPEPAILESVHFEVDIATTCTAHDSYYFFAVLGCDDAIGAHGGSAALAVSDGALALWTYAAKDDAGHYLIDGGGGGTPEVSKLLLATTWQHLVVTLTPPYGVEATLGPSPEGVSSAVFTNNNFGYGCPQATAWSFHLGAVYNDGPACELRFDNFLLDYTGKDGGSH
jgi:hypothetical protein